MTVPRIAALTNRGRQRPENQDAVMAARAGAYTLIAVADGLGGLANGAVASRHAMSRVRTAFRSEEPSDPLERIVAALEAANGEFVEVANGEPEKAMGTTAVGILFGPAGTATFNIGDSRAYLLREGILRQLTDDHSVAADRMREGLLNPEEIATDPRRNQLTRCVGVDAAFGLDTTEPGPPLPGDRYLVCSDGLYGCVPDDEIARILVGANDPLEAAARLVEAANGAGGPDNISAGLAFLDEGEVTPR